MPEWPGYTPPPSGSSQNSGTHPLSQYTGIEDGVKIQYTADGADTTQMPPQYYGNWTNQKRNEPEQHKDVTAPAQPTAVTGGSGKATVSWPPQPNKPVNGYEVTASSGQKASVKGSATSATVSGLTVAASVTFTVTAKGEYGTATSPASASFTVA